MWWSKPGTVGSGASPTPGLEGSDGKESGGSAPDARIRKGRGVQGMAAREKGIPHQRPQALVPAREKGVMKSLLNASTLRPSRQGEATEVGGWVQRPARSLRPIPEAVAGA
jgi:hypothetical protein